MLQYLLKRILYFIPTFFLISLIIFFLSKSVGEQLDCTANPERIDLEQCKHEANLKGYDKPIFYFTFSTAAHPDTLYKIFREERRNALHYLIGQYGNWPQISHYYQLLNQLEGSLEEVSSSKSSQGITNMYKAISLLQIKHQDPVILSQLAKMEIAIKDTTLTSLNSQVKTLAQAYDSIKETATPNKLLVPNINWYGLNNQYHFWVTNFLTGNFGISNQDRKPVFDKIKEKLPWTLYINIPAIIIAYILSILLGVYTAKNRNSRFDKIVSVGLLLLFSLPVFWIGTMLVNFFTTPEFGMKWFPSAELKGDSLTWENMKRLFLPIICITYPALAFMTRQMRSSMLDTLQQDYIRTARAKGLSEKLVIWRHAFRNSLFPLITIFGTVLPAAFAGSVIVERIFNITGMGWLLLGSISSNDWPVVYAIIMVTAVLTMLGLLIADILYVIADPRIRLEKK